MLKHKISPEVILITQIVISTLLSWAIMTVVFPDLFLFHKLSFIRYQDAEYNYYGVFTLLSNFYHGGIQLWNNYDQMPLAYYYLTGGMTSFSNLITAIVYILLSPLFTSPSVAFQNIYSVFYYIPSIFIITCGFYFLLSRFTNNIFILLASTVLSSSIYIPAIFFGLNSGSIYSFIPLLIHLILKVFEKGRLRDFLLAVLTLAVCIAMNAILGIGYFYQAINFVLIPSLIWFVVKHRSLFYRPERIKRIFPKRINEAIYWKIILTAIVCIVLISPMIYLFRENLKDYEVSYDTSRFSNIKSLDIRAYFTRVNETAPIGEFFYRLVDYKHNNWLHSWLFVGSSAVFLAITGFILSRDSRKYIFFGALLFIYSINAPKSMTGWQAPFHWINALTNPFNFAVRSYHMPTAYVLSFILMPLVTMGIQSLIDIDGKALFIRSIIKRMVIIIIMIVYLTAVYPEIDVEVKYYLNLNFIIFLILLLLSLMKFNYKKVLIPFLLLILFILESSRMGIYMKQFSELVYIKPHNVREGPTGFLLDYQNPKVLPFREYYNSVPIPKVSGYDKVDPINMQGLFYRYTDLQKFFTPAQEWTPRHVSYANLSREKVLQRLLGEENRLIYQADMGVGENVGTLESILDNHLNKSVITISKNPNIPGLFSSDLVNELKFKTPNKEEAIKMKEIKWLKEGSNVSNRNGLRYYIYELPSDFPKYLTTGIYTNDISLLKAKLGDSDLQPGQGALISPYTFDVQNYISGSLTVALPGNSEDGEKTVSLQYPETPATGIINIWRNEPDNLGFDYKSEKDGWLVFQYPYDKKWRILLDNSLVETYKVNLSFLGIPVKKGTHKILLSYFPNPLIRILIAQTILLIIILPFIIIWLEIKDERKYDRYLNNSTRI